MRAEIRSAAGRLLARDGYDALSLRAIGRELGCSAATPYTYFSSREEIVQAVRADAFDLFADCLERAGAGIEDPIERLRALVRAYAKFGAQHPEHYRMMFELKQTPCDLSPELQAARSRSFQQPLLVATQAVEQGRWNGEPMALAHMIWATCHGLMALQLAGQLDLGWSLEALVEPTLALLSGEQTRVAPRRSRND